MEAVACQRILALQELDPAHLRHDDHGASHPAVGAGAAADRMEAVAERGFETHRAAMALAGPNGRVARHVAGVSCQDCFDAWSWWEDANVSDVSSPRGDHDWLTETRLRTNVSPEFEPDNSEKIAHDGRKTLATAQCRCQRRCV